MSACRVDTRYFSALSYRLFTSVTLVTYIYQSRTYISQATLPPFPLKIPLHNLSAVFISTAFFVCTFCFKLFFFVYTDCMGKKVSSVKCSLQWKYCSSQPANGQFNFICLICIFICELWRKNSDHNTREKWVERERKRGVNNMTWNILYLLLCLGEGVALWILYEIMFHVWMSIWCR